MKIRKRKYRNGTVAWQADLGVVDGRRVQKSFKTKAKAEGCIEERRGELEWFGNSAVFLSDTQRADWIVAGNRLAEVGATIHQAVEFFLRHAKPRTETTSFAEMSLRCVEAKRAEGRSHPYCESLRRLAVNFGRCDGFGGRPAHLVSAEDIAGYVKGNGWSAKTQNVYTAALTSIFAWGLAQKIVAINPCKEVSRPRVGEASVNVFTPAECTLLMDAALDTAAADNLALLPYVAICLFAGVRMEECEKLTWRNVNIAERFIEIPIEVAKRVRGVRRRIIGMSENLAAWLMRAPVQEGPIPPVDVRRRMRKLRAAAGLKTWPNRVLRHSFASYHLAKHRNAEQTRLDMGHHDTSMLFSTYRELVRPKDAEAFWGIVPNGAK